MPGPRFRDKYSVEEARNIYRGDTTALKIPPKGHPLYDPTSPTTFDPLRVEAIDRDGHMNDPIEVWTDPDNDTLWVLDGRGRLLDVREVNRRRADQGRDLVLPYITPYKGTETEALRRLREKNYHRRTPKFSDVAQDIRVLRKKGIPCADIAMSLHVVTTDPDNWCLRHGAVFLLHRRREGRHRREGDPGHRGGEVRGPDLGRE